MTIYRVSDRNGRNNRGGYRAKQVTKSYVQTKISNSKVLHVERKDL